MNDLVSVQMEMKVKRSDCFVFELPKGISKDEFETILIEAEDLSEFIDEWKSTICCEVHRIADAYPKISYHEEGVEDGELEMLQYEQGNIFNNHKK